MKKFGIKEADPGKWLVSHNEYPKFACQFENKKFHNQRTLTGLSNPSGDLNEIRLLDKMEKWLQQYHKDKITNDNRALNDALNPQFEFYGSTIKYIKKYNTQW